MKSFVIAALSAIVSAESADDYTYMVNGEDWANLCSTGQEQSPIDLATATEVYNLAAQPEFYPMSNSLNIGLPAPATRNRGKAAIKVTLADGNYSSLIGDAQMRLRLPGASSDSTWQPIQYHFHAPSEHTISGELLDAEMHIVHLPSGQTATDMANNVAVFGITFRESDCEAIEDRMDQRQCLRDRLYSDNFFNSMSVFAAGDNTLEFSDTVQNIPLQAFINSLDKGRFFSYNGSFTTPPCTEGVKWTVLADPVPISPEHLASMNSRYVNNLSFAPCLDDSCTGGNNRVTMPVNAREVFFNNSGATYMAALSAIAFGATVASISI